MGKCFRQVYQRPAVFLVALVLLLPGYSTAAERILKIDPGHVEGIQDMPSEITAMLEDLGYEWLPVRDPVTRQPVQDAERNGEYRMLFRSTADAAVMVDVHIRIGDNITGLHFSVTGSDLSADVAQDYYRKLRDRAVLEFGAGSVSDGSSFFTP